MRNTFIIAAFAIGALAITSSQNACNNEMAAYKIAENTAASTGVPDPVPTETQGPKSFDVKLESQSTVSGNLADERKFKVKATAQTAFSGPLKISLDRAALAVLDPSNEISITPALVPMSLLPGQSQEFEVTVKSTSLAPSGAGKFAFVAKPDSPDFTGEARLNFDLGIAALYEVLILGRVNGVMQYNRDFTQANFRSHVGGLTVRFLNADRVEEHTIHGSPQQYHQPANNPMDVAGPNGPVAGGVYEFKVMPSTTASNISYHCHIHGGADHRLRVNVQ